MTKHLRIEVNGNEWVNGDFAEITFVDGPTGVKIEGKIESAAGGNGGLFGMLMGKNPGESAAAPQRRTITPRVPIRRPTPKPDEVLVPEPELEEHLNYDPVIVETVEDEPEA